MQNKILFLKFNTGKYKIAGTEADSYQQKVSKQEALDLINGIEYIDVDSPASSEVHDTLVSLYEGIVQHGKYVIKSTVLEASYT